MAAVGALVGMIPSTGTTGGELRMGAGGLIPLAHPGPPSGQGGPNTSFCSSLVSNASLNTSVAATYSELANLSGPSRANQSGAPGHSSSNGLTGYPSEANASLLVRSWWASVCLGPTFGPLIQRWGTANFSWSFNVGSAGATWKFGVIWTEGCTIPQVGAFSGCQYAEFWTGDLKSQNFSGPTTTASPPCGTLICPVYVVGPGTPPSPTPSPWSTALAFLRAYGVFIGAAAVAVAVGLLIVRALPIRTEPQPPRDSSKGNEKESPVQRARPDPLDDVI
jgi:hypothetical protein